MCVCVCGWVGYSQCTKKGKDNIFQIKMITFILAVSCHLYAIFLQIIEA